MTQGEDMDRIERARVFFRELERTDFRTASEVARRAFFIQERLAEN